MGPFLQQLLKVDNLTSGLSESEEMALVQKLGALEVENKQLKKVTDDLKALSCHSKPVLKHLKEENHHQVLQNLPLHQLKMTMTMLIFLDLTTKRMMKRRRGSQRRG